MMPLSLLVLALEHHLLLCLPELVEVFIPKLQTLGLTLLGKLNKEYQKMTLVTLPPSRIMLVTMLVTLQEWVRTYLNLMWDR